MNEDGKPREISRDRRRVLGVAGAAALVTGAAQLGVFGSAIANASVKGKPDLIAGAGMKYRHLTFDVGHNVPQEAPRRFAEAVVAVDHF